MQRPSSPSPRRSGLAPRSVNTASASPARAPSKPRCPSVGPASAGDENAAPNGARRACSPKTVVPPRRPMSRPSPGSRSATASPSAAVVPGTDGAVRRRTPRGSVASTATPAPSALASPRGSEPSPSPRHSLNSITAVRGLAAPSASSSMPRPRSVSRGSSAPSGARASALVQRALSRSSQGSQGTAAPTAEDSNSAQPPVDGSSNHEQPATAPSPGASEPALSAVLLPSPPSPALQAAPRHGVSFADAAALDGPHSPLSKRPEVEAAIPSPSRLSNPLCASPFSLRSSARDSDVLSKAGGPPSPPLSQARMSHSARMASAFADTTRTGPPGSGSERVTVAVRVRPMTAAEKERGAAGCVGMSMQQAQVAVDGHDKPFQCDYALWSDSGAGEPKARPGDLQGVPEVTQRDVYELLGAPLVTHAMAGFNACLLAYGQTGTGKTHTMLGPPPKAVAAYEDALGARAAATPQRRDGTTPLARRGGASARRGSGPNGRSPAPVATPQRSAKKAPRPGDAKSETKAEKEKAEVKAEEGGGEQGAFSFVRRAFSALTGAAEMQVEADPATPRPLPGPRRPGVLNGFDDAALDATPGVAPSAPFVCSATDENAGVIPRLCEDLLGRVRALETVGEAGGECCTWAIEASYVEVYCEHLTDLLTGAPIAVREVAGAFTLAGAERRPVRRLEDVWQLLADGNNRRATAATNMNERSSRSHAVFILHLAETVRVRMPDGDTATAAGRSATVKLVDLAGSERVDDSGATGERLKEARAINKSLATLGRVIDMLADAAKIRARRPVDRDASPGSPQGRPTSPQSAKGLGPRRPSSAKLDAPPTPTSVPVPPYRESVLTKILKDSLGGNSKTTMVAAVGPAAQHRSQTLSTLHYATRARAIVNTPTVNVDPQAEELRLLHDELESVRRQLDEARAMCAAAEATQATPLQFQGSGAALFFSPPERRDTSCGPSPAPPSPAPKTPEHHATQTSTSVAGLTDAAVSPHQRVHTSASPALLRHREALEARLEEAQGRLRAFSVERQQQRAELAAKEEHLSELLVGNVVKEAHLQRAVDAAEEQRAELEARVALREAEVAAAEQALRDRDEAAAAREAALSAAVAARDETVGSLRAQTAAAAAEVAAAEAGRVAAEQALSAATTELQGALASQGQELDDMAGAAVDGVRREAELRAERDGLTAAVSEREAELRRCEGELLKRQQAHEEAFVGARQRFTERAEALERRRCEQEARFRRRIAALEAEERDVARLVASKSSHLDEREAKLMALGKAAYLASVQSRLEAEEAQEKHEAGRHNYAQLQRLCVVQTHQLRDARRTAQRQDRELRRMRELLLGASGGDGSDGIAALSAAVERALLSSRGSSASNDDAPVENALKDAHERRCSAHDNGHVRAPGRSPSAVARSKAASLVARLEKFHAFVSASGSRASSEGPAKHGSQGSQGRTTSGPRSTTASKTSSAPSSLRASASPAPRRAHSATDANRRGTLPPSFAKARPCGFADGSGSPTSSRPSPSPQPPRPVLTAAGLVVRQPPLPMLEAQPLPGRGSGVSPQKQNYKQQQRNPAAARRAMRGARFQPGLVISPRTSPVKTSVKTAVKPSAEAVPKAAPKIVKVVAKAAASTEVPKVHGGKIVVARVSPRKSPQKSPRRSHKAAPAPAVVVAHVSPRRAASPSCSPAPESPLRHKHVEGRAGKASCSVSPRRAHGTHGTHASPLPAGSRSHTPAAASPLQHTHNEGSPRRSARACALQGTTSCRATPAQTPECSPVCSPMRHRHTEGRSPSPRRSRQPLLQEGPLDETLPPQPQPQPQVPKDKEPKGSDAMPSRSASRASAFSSLPPRASEASTMIPEGPGEVAAHVTEAGADAFEEHGLQPPAPAVRPPSAPRSRRDPSPVPRSRARSERSSRSASPAVLAASAVASASSSVRPSLAIPADADAARASQGLRSPTYDESVRLSVRAASADDGHGAASGRPSAGTQETALSASDGFGSCFSTASAALASYHASQRRARPTDARSARSPSLDVEVVRRCPTPPSAPVGADGRTEATEAPHAPLSAAGSRRVSLASSLSDALLDLLDDGASAASAESPRLPDEDPTIASRSASHAPSHGPRRDSALRAMETRLQPRGGKDPSPDPAIPGGDAAPPTDAAEGELPYSYYADPSLGSTVRVHSTSRSPAPQWATAGGIPPTTSRRSSLTSARTSGRVSTEPSVRLSVRPAEEEEDPYALEPTPLKRTFGTGLAALLSPTTAAEGAAGGAAAPRPSAQERLQELRQQHRARRSSASTTE